MRRNLVAGLFLVKPKYGLALTLCLCIVTVFISLYYLEDLTLRRPRMHLNVFPRSDQNHMPGLQLRQTVILNDINIEVANDGKEGLGQPVEADLKNLSNLVDDNQKIIHHWHSGNQQQPSPPREKYIIYYCKKNMTCCGWGDRQHGILSAYVISLVTNRTFGVDMSSPCPLNYLFHTRKLNWRVNSSALEGLSTKYLYTVNDKVFRQLMSQINFDSVYPQDVVYLTTNYDYFYSLKNNPFYKKIFRQKLKTKPRPLVFADLWLNIFKLNKRVKNQVNKAIAKARPTKNHKLVCAHLRFGKNPTLPMDWEVRNTLETVKPVWEFLKMYQDPNRYRIFVATDSEDVRSKVKELFPFMRIEIEGDIIHIDKMRHSEVDPCNGFEKVLADQYLLSTCDVLVLTYSVFGKGAAYMRKSNDNLFFLENGQIKQLKVFSEKVAAQNAHSKT